MSQSTDRFAYRCLPLNIANAHGWLILNGRPIIASWNGESGIDAVSVSPCGTDGPLLASSHFGLGVLTFTVAALFQTEPGYDLFVMGPSNQPKDGIHPLTGIVETDWSPFSFTMNWKFTRKHTKIAFERDEPFCMIFPVRRNLVEDCVPEVQQIKENKELDRAFQAFSKSRLKFNSDLKRPGSQARKEKWQKEYFRGLGPFTVAPPEHRTKLNLKEFKRR